MASPTQWTWVWVSSGSWWWTGKLSVLQSMGSQRVGHDWATELNWRECWPSLAHPPLFSLPRVSLNTWCSLWSWLKSTLLCVTLTIPSLLRPMWPSSSDEKSSFIYFYLFPVLFTQDLMMVLRNYSPAFSLPLNHLLYLRLFKKQRWLHPM